MTRDLHSLDIMTLSADELSALKDAQLARHAARQAGPAEGLQPGTLGEEYKKLALRRGGGVFARSLRMLSGLISDAVRPLARLFGGSKSLTELLQESFDEAWYLAEYPDVRSNYASGWQHFKDYGIQEGRNPNPFFDSRWYLNRYADVRVSGIPAIIHYLEHGAREKRDPHPDFDAAWYAREYPEAAANVLNFHVLKGRQRGYLTERLAGKQQIATGSVAKFHRKHQVAISVIIPVYRGLDECKQCLNSVLGDTANPPDEIIVVDDCSPEPEISRWLDELAQGGAIRLVRNTRNLGFVASVNAGMEAAGRNDVVLLNSDTIVPSNWLPRLKEHAYSSERVGTVTPLSNNATICSYPHPTGGPMPPGFSVEELDRAARTANPGCSVTIPTAVGFAMYIRRDCLEDVGLFDHETFGLGYGEENDFCLRAIERGWSNELACDVFVYHKGEVSFGGDSARKQKAFEILKQRYPHYVRTLHEFSDRDPVAAYRFALTSELLRQTHRDTVLLITHALGGGTERHVQELISICSPPMMFLLLRPTRRGCELTVPSLDGHAKLTFAYHELPKLIQILKTFELRRIHVHHVIYFGFDVRDIVKEVGVPFDFTVHDYFAICPRVNLLSPALGHYCGEPAEAACNSCIASSPPPTVPARDIFEHRWKFDWLFTEAERIICPSEDVRLRLIRYGHRDRLVTIPHEEAFDTSSRNAPQTTSRKGIRVAMLGALVPHKGLALVRQTIIEARGQNIEFVLIGASGPGLSLPMGLKFRETGRYEQAALPKLIDEVAPDVFWFPAVWPETYSYTLTTALSSGKPVVGTDLGAFPERTSGYPNVTLLPVTAPPVEWVAALKQAGNRAGAH